MADIEKMSEMESFTDSPQNITPKKRRKLRSLCYDFIHCLIQNPTICLIIIVVILICLDIILKTDNNNNTENYSSYINKTRAVIFDILEGS